MSKTIEKFFYRAPLDAALMNKRFEMPFEVFDGTVLREITYERLRLSSYGWWTVSDGAYVEEAELLRWFHRDSLHLLKALRYDVSGGRATKTSSGGRRCTVRSSQAWTAPTPSMSWCPTTSLPCWRCRPDLRAARPPFH